MPGLQFTYPPQEPECTPTTNTAPTIVPTVQPSPVANITTYVLNTPPPLDNDQHATDTATADSDAEKKGGGGQTSNSNNCTHHAATEPRQEQPHNPFAVYHVSFNC